MATRQLMLVFLMAILATANSCAGALYKVKPAIELPPLTDSARSASAGGVLVRAVPMLSDEESQEFFEANLPLSGILAVRVEMTFESGVAVEIKRARFSLRDGAGTKWKLVSAKEAISRVLKANEIYAYNPNSRKQFEKEFAAYAIDLKLPLSDSDRRRQGFLFFETPKKEPVASPRGLVLLVERLPQPVEIQLTNN